MQLLTREDKFITDYSHQFPKFMTIKELLRYNLEGKLKPIIFKGEMVGFFVIDGTHFKSLFIQEDMRKYSRELLPHVFRIVKNREYVTMAVSPNDPKIRKFAVMNGFKRTNQTVIGKICLLEIWEYKR
jgi:hypothetical protein